MRTFDNPRQGGAKGSTVSDMSEEWGGSFLSEKARQRYMERLQARRNGQKTLSNLRPASTPADPNLCPQKPLRDFACTDDFTSEQTSQAGGLAYQPLLSHRAGGKGISPAHFLEAL